MSYHTIGALGIISPTGQSWNTPTYQACIGKKIQQCGEYAYAQQWSSAQVNACIDMEQQFCIAAAKAALATVLTSAQIQALQNAINTTLSKYGYCPIAVDGKIGPTTCGAAAWAAGTGAAVTVPGVCGKTVAMGTGFLKDCPAAAPPVVVAPPPAAPPPVIPKPPPVVPYVPPTKPKMTTANILVAGVALTAVAAGGYWLAKKKGWIKP